MPRQSARRQASGSGVKRYTEHRRKIGDNAVVHGVEVEFARTLPFWRCYTDLHQETKCKPEVVQRTTELVMRIPCRVFRRVDVVWARTVVQLRRTYPAWRISAGAKAAQQRMEREGCDTKESNSFATLSDKRANKDVNATDTLNGTVTHTIDTLHFVHHDAYKKGAANDRSFHIQSVVLRDMPAMLQCVAGAMVSFSFLVFTSLRLVHQRRGDRRAFSTLSRELEQQAQEYTQLFSEPTSKRKKNEAAGPSPTSPPALTLFCEAPVDGVSSAHSSYATLRRWCPPPTSRVLILGMGGNSMALALRAVLGPAARIEVVEVEPAVVAACRQAGTLSDDTDENMQVHLQDADACLRTLPNCAYDFIYMDIFEPIGATMRNLHPWVVAAREKLTAGGLLVMNEHQLPSAEGLAPYVRLFGNGNVQAVNLRGWKESVVVCVAPGDSETDTHSLEITKTHMDLAFNVYEALMPGWLPHFSWLVVSKTHQFAGTRCRLWTS